MTTIPTASIHGYCAPGFESVGLAFARNFAEQDEIGAAVSVFLNGDKVVDLWGGYKNREKQIPWQEDTLVCFMSTSKAIASLAVLSLVDRYGLDIDKPVAHYWPAFAQGGKEKITVRCMLAQLAGLPVVDAVDTGDFYNFEALINGLAAQSPMWPAGSTPCYHSFTHGPLCQTLLEMITGKTLGQYLREDLFGPAGIDFYVGLTPEEQSRCADLVVADGVPTIEKMNAPDTLIHRAWRPFPGLLAEMNTERFRACEFASGNGHGTARAVAEIFSRLAAILNRPADYVNGHQLLSRPVLEDAIIEQWDAVEKITHRHFRYGTGFMLNNRYFTTGPNPRSFGHPGLGGAIGFADPDVNLGFAYAGNHIHAIDNTGPCAGALIDAVYQSLAAV